MPVLVPAASALRAEMDEIDIDYANAPTWDMLPMLEYVETNHVNNWNCSLGDEYAEIEPNTIITRNVSLKGFQLSKLRENNIPAKKKLGEIKQDIMLEDDEFIGEFVTCLYDSQLGVLAIQSNRYGLTTNQVEEFLTNIRLIYCSAINDAQEQEDPQIVKLRPILDTNGMAAALNAEIIRKIKLRAADFMSDARLADEPLLGSARNCLSTFSGASVEITISVGQSRTETLCVDKIRRSIKLFNEYRTMSPNAFNLELTKKDDADSSVDTINLVTPRMTDVVSAEIAPRTSIGHGYLLSLILEKYMEKRSVFHRILIPPEE